MNSQQGLSTSRPLRVWPAAIFAVLYLIFWQILPKIWPDQGMYWFFGSLLCAFAVLVWWLFLSRAPWLERLAAIALIAVAVVITSKLIHPSVAGAGMNMLFRILSPATALMGLALAVILTQRLGQQARRVVLVATILFATGAWALVRLDGIRASGGPDYAWRWSPTPEERLIAETKDEPLAPSAAPAPVAEPAKEAAPAAAEKTDAKPAEKSAEPTAAPPAAAVAPAWPGFRGPNRNSVVPGLRIQTDWAASPPVEMWRRSVGPGWSSFAVSGDLIYTQEQRGDYEIVACYNLKTGKPVWLHRDKTRFWEANAGAGPRGTPTLSGGRAYTFGATGIVNALDAASGGVVWTRNASTDAGVKVPYWGFASSPLVVNDLVVVAVSGRLAAYDLASGQSRWLGPESRRGSYGSPHLLTIDGVPQVLLLNGTGVTSVAPADGKVLWFHEWEAGGATMLQPTMTTDGDVLITTTGMNGGEGTRRLTVKHATGAWTVQEKWTSRGLKPYFNDLVVHKGHAYGFDGSILACINLENGERKWKGGRYGNGQLVLLADQDLLIVLSEDGEIALVSATPDEYKEVAKVPALEGKTWNHPALAGDVLLVRNDKEMAAFRLPMARSGDD